MLLEQWLVKDELRCHSICLLMNQEALDLQPGHCFLDIGSGSGLLTACGALLVGAHSCLHGLQSFFSVLTLSRKPVIVPLFGRMFVRERYS